LFDILGFPLSFLPRTIGAVIASKVSLQRIASFLRGEELDPLAVEDIIELNNAIEVEDASFSWKENEVTLTDIKLGIPVGQLLAVVGEVGCGKSSLLLSLLGEMPKTKGKVFEEWKSYRFCTTTSLD